MGVDRPAGMDNAKTSSRSSDAPEKGLGKVPSVAAGKVDDGGKDGLVKVKELG